MRVRDVKKFQSVLVIQGVSYRKLAEVAGYASHAHISALMQGKKTGIKPEAAHKIAAYLGMPVDHLFVSHLSSNTGETGQGGRAA